MYTAHFMFHCPCYHGSSHVLCRRGFRACVVVVMSQKSAVALRYLCTNLRKLVSSKYSS